MHWDPERDWPRPMNPTREPETVDEVIQWAEEEFARLKKQRQVRERRLLTAEFYAKKALLSSVRIALIGVLALIVIWTAMLCWPAVEAGLIHVLHWTVPQN